MTSRKQVREFLRSARYFIKHGDYVQAIQYLVWAIRAEAFLDGKDVGVDRAMPLSIGELGKQVARTRRRNGMAT